jgi:hypothetical protein
MTASGSDESVDGGEAEAFGAGQAKEATLMLLGFLLLRIFLLAIRGFRL